MPLTYPPSIADFPSCLCWPRSQDQKPLPGEQQNEQHPRHEQLHRAGDPQPAGCAFPLRLPAPSATQVSAMRGEQPQGSAWGAAGSPMFKAQAHSTLAIFGLFPWWRDVAHTYVQGWKLPGLSGCRESSHKLGWENIQIFRGHPGGLALL